MQKMSFWRYNTKTRPRSFLAGDLLWRMKGDAQKDRVKGKFASNWEGPFSFQSNRESEQRSIMTRNVGRKTHSDDIEL